MSDASRTFRVTLDLTLGEDYLLPADVESAGVEEVTALVRARFALDDDRHLFDARIVSVGELR